MSAPLPFEQAPKDGRTILVCDENDQGVRHGNAVFYYRYSDEDREEDGIEEEGCWIYADTLLSDACPDGPAQPFEWLPDPFYEAVQ